MKKNAVKNKTFFGPTIIPAMVKILLLLYVVVKKYYDNYSMFNFKPRVNKFQHFGRVTLWPVVNVPSNNTKLLGRSLTIKIR